MKKYFLLLILFFAVAKGLYAQHFEIADSLPKGAYGTAAWGDYDGDGRKDLVYITQTQVPGDPDIFYVYHNTAAGLVKLPQVFNSITNPAAAWGDLDNDGKEDLVVSGMGNVGHLFIFKSNGDGTFAEQTGAWQGFSFGSIAIADYNNDGLKDIAANGILNSGLFETGTVIFKNQGGFNFTDIQAGLTGVFRGEMKWYDYDQDGKADLSYNGVTDDDKARVFIYRNDGNDDFHQVNGFMPGAIDGTVDWMDYNADGRKDLVVSGVDSNGASIFTDLYKNNGDGTFPLITSNLVAFGEPSAADVADFNNDGKPDICLVGSSALFPNAGAVFLNDGTANFSQLVLPFTQIDVLTNCIVAAADIDNDGDQDLLCSNYILKNTGSPVAIREQEINRVAIYPNPVATGYVYINNPLSQLEIVLTDISGRIRLRQQLGKGLHKIDLNNCAAGIYELILSAGKKERLVKPLVVHQ